METNQTIPTTATKQKKKAPLSIIIITLLVAALTFIAFGVILAMQLEAQKGTVSLTPTPTETQATTPEPTSDTIPARKLVYLSIDALWISDTKGQNKKKLRDLPQINGNYMDPRWKNTNEVTYAACTTAQKCNLYLVNIQTGQQTVEIGDVPGFTLNGIWQDDKTLFYGLFLNPVSTELPTDDKIYIKTGSNSKLLQKFGTTKFQVEQYQDNVVRFSLSPDKSKAMVFNLRAGSTEEDYMINTYIYDKTGKKLMDLKSVSADFLTNNKIAYIYRDTLHIADIGGAETATHQIVFEPQEVLMQLRAAPDGNRVSFWSDVGGSFLFIYDIETKKRVKLSENFVPEGKWLSDETIIGRKTHKDSNAQNGFTIENGLSVINVKSGQINEIIGDQVIDYDVE